MKTFLNTAIAGLAAVIFTLGISGCVAASEPICPATDPYCHEEDYR